MEPAVELTYFLTLPGFAGITTMKEKWYGTDYNICSLDNVSQIDRWTTCLQGSSEWAESVFLPLKNPFVPTDFNIRASAVKSAAATPESAASDVAVTGASEARAVPDLIECVTTLSVEAEEEVVEAVTDSVASAEVSTGKPADDSTGKGADDDEEEEEGEVEEEEPAGQLPPLEGKVTQ